MHLSFERRKNLLNFALEATDFSLAKANKFVVDVNSIMLKQSSLLFLTIVCRLSLTKHAKFSFTAVFTDVLILKRNKENPIYSVSRAQN